MNKTIKHRFSVSKKTFWENVYFNEGYTKGLFLEGMNCETFEVLSQSGSVDAKLERQIKSTPRVDMPKALKKVLGDAVSYTESGTFDANTGRRIVVAKVDDAPRKLRPKKPKGPKPAGGLRGRRSRLTAAAKRTSDLVVL